MNTIAEETTDNIEQDLEQVDTLNFLEDLSGNTENEIMEMSTVLDTADILAMEIMM